MPCLEYKIEAVRRPTTELPRDGMATITGISYSQGKPLDRATAFAFNLENKGPNPGGQAPDLRGAVDKFADKEGRFTLKVPTNRRIMLRIIEDKTISCGIKFRTDERFDVHVRMVLEPKNERPLR